MWFILVLLLAYLKWDSGVRDLALEDDLVWDGSLLFETSAPRD